MPASHYFYSSERNLLFPLTFQQVPLIVLKIVWGVSPSCVMVATLTLLIFGIIYRVSHEKSYQKSSTYRKNEITNIKIDLY